MTKTEVVSFEEAGPYRYFSNGDPETYNGVFNGRKANIQFYFDDTGLHRILVSLYEGNDIDVARDKWREAYEALSSKYGHIETPTIHLEPPGTEVGSEVLAIAAAADVYVGNKVQMAPEKQPEGEFVFSSFTRQEVDKKPFYTVSIYFDRPH